MKGTELTMTTHPKPLLIAHRGASQKAPENTLAAFNLAWQEGADGIEADFRLTRDSRIVCLHDASTGRTAGVDLRVADVTLEELSLLDIGIWKGPHWQGERILTLEEVLARLPEGKMLFIELKSGPEIIEPLRRILIASGIPAGQLRLLAFDSGLVALLKEQLPDFRVCLNVDYRWSLRKRSWIPTMEDIRTILGECRADGLSSRAHSRLDASFAAELQRCGKELHVWTVDALRTARHFQHIGVDSIMTNCPGRLVSRLNTAGSGGEIDASP